MTKDEAFEQINSLQDKYINQLIALIYSSEYSMKKTLNFTSATGTGKTKMMSKLINKLPDYFFIVTTLSKGQLNLQVKANLEKDCLYKNFYVYGSSDYRINSKLDADDIINRIPYGKQCIWLRDEGHIKTNRFDEVLLDVCFKVINFSATNIDSDIKCNFLQTMMLRTVNQNNGTPGMAIQILLMVKKEHKKVKNYNPCAIFRCVENNHDLYEEIIYLCQKYNLKYIDISKESYNMAELCQDNNEYDVIINKLKLVEGIDIRRAHVIFMDNQPSNNTTTIQAIGRCRRNALLYRNDINIFSKTNKKLLEATRECYVIYNVAEMNIPMDENGELQFVFCNHISCQELIPGTSIDVINGQLDNGYYIIELDGLTGTYHIDIDPSTGFNIVSPKTDFYNTILIDKKSYIYTPEFKKIQIKDISQLPICTTKRQYIPGTNDYTEVECEPYYFFWPYCNTSPLFDSDLTKEEKYKLEKKWINTFWGIKKSALPKYLSGEYTKIYNDKESAIIGVDFMHQITQRENKYDYDVIWCEQRNITSKVGSYNKLNSFITKKYSDEITQAQNQLFSGHNNFEFDTKCNSILGYCVEYYSKYLIYGEKYLRQYIDVAKKEINTDSDTNALIIRACMLKYKDNMIATFGIGTAKYIRSLSTNQLNKEQYHNFIETVIKLGTKAASYVKETLYPNIDAEDNIDFNLSIKHIAGMADYITKDTILDIKVRNNIDEKCVRQVLGYHYLSTKRSDLFIQKVIVYDAVSGKSVIVNITDKNQKKNTNFN